MLQDEFTKEELNRINILYGTDFKDIKPDDALIIGRFEAMRAKQDAEFQKRLETMENESNARIKACEAEKRKALSNLKDLHNAAIARLDRVENGK